MATLWCKFTRNFANPPAITRHRRRVKLAAALRAVHDTVGALHDASAAVLASHGAALVTATRLTAAEANAVDAKEYFEKLSTATNLRVPPPAAVTSAAAEAVPAE